VTQVKASHVEASLDNGIFYSFVTCWQCLYSMSIFQ